MPHYNPDAGCCDDPAAGDLFPDPLNLKLNGGNCGRVASILIDENACPLLMTKLKLQVSVR